MTASDQESIFIQGLPGPDGETPPPRPAGAPFPEVLPVLGLSDIVVFPGMVVPLLVESACSVRLIDDVVAGDRLVVLALQKQAELDWSAATAWTASGWDRAC